MTGGHPTYWLAVVIALICVAFTLRVTFVVADLIADAVVDLVGLHDKHESRLEEIERRLGIEVNQDEFV